MEHCHHHHSQSIFDFASFGEIGVLLTIFVTGVLGSLTHCIGMCGPLAAAQTSMRLMGVQNSRISELERLKVSLLLPYYFGKAITYTTLTALFIVFKNSIGSVAEIPAMKWLTIAFLIAVAGLFAHSAFQRSFIIPIPGLRKVTQKFAKFISPWRLSSYGFQGILLGMILGLIPCGLVYGVIINATANMSSTPLALAAIFLFGFSTTPGLFIASFFGTQILSRFKQSFKLLYALLMLINAGLLLQYALKLI